MATIKIIDNKKVLMTEDEWSYYNQICKSYDKPPSFNGKELFVGLFESDDNGMIVFIKPPSNRYTSMEAVLFIMILMQQQQIRNMQKQTDDLCNELRAEFKKIVSPM